MREARHQSANARGVPIRFKELARVLHEDVFEAGNYYGFLSSSGEGKTSMIMQLVTHALRAGCPVQFQSFDQSDEQLVRQMVAQEFAVEAKRQKIGDLSPVEYDTIEPFVEWLDKQRFEVVSCHKGESAGQLVAYADDFVGRYRRRRNPETFDFVPLIVTDHIMSITPQREDQRSDPGTKARGINSIIKAGAKRNGAAWMMVNQRNTTGMRRDNPKPIGDDLFGGDQAKQAYDAVAYLYRYKKFYDDRAKVATTKSEKDKLTAIFPEDVRTGVADIAELGAIKVRFGDPNGRETMDFEGRFTRYKSHNESLASSAEQEAFAGFT